MIKYFKIELIPTSEQQKLIFKSFKVARFAYNWTLEKQINYYHKYNRLIHKYELRKQYDAFKYKHNANWQKDISAKVSTQAIFDCCNNVEKYIHQNRPFPKFKSEKHSKLSFFHREDKIFFTANQVYLEKIGKVSLAESNRIPQDTTYYNPRITYDGLKFWLSIGCKTDTPEINSVQNPPIGIDLGLKNLMVCSNGLEFHQIDIHKELKKLKRLQRQASRLYVKFKNTETNKSKNLIKLEIKILKQHRRIHNIILNNIHQSTSKIMKYNPSHIVLEDLKVKTLQKNKYITTSLSYSCFYEIRKQIGYKSKVNNIKVILADKYYPSSKICSNCNKIKYNLSIKDRIFYCEYCGIRIDRDLNASINLSKLVTTGCSKN